MKRFLLPFTALIFGALMSVPASAANITISVPDTACASWNFAGNQLTCVAPTTSGPPTCSALTPSSTTPDTAFTLTATCSGNGGAINLWRFAEGASEPTTTWPYSSPSNTVNFAAASATAGPHTFWVSASKDNGTTWGAAYSQTITFSASTPTAPYCYTISPASATTGQAQTFSVNCSGAVTSYAWSAAGASPASASTATFQTTFASAGTYNVSVQACNGSACATTVNQSVLVTDSAPPTGTISCAAGGSTPISGISSTWVLPGQGQNYDLGTTGYKRIYSNELGTFAGNTAVVIAFKTPNWTTTGSVAVAEVDSTPIGHLVTISRSPCSTYGNHIVYGTGQQATAFFGVGTDLQPNTVYYATIVHRNYSRIDGTWKDSCGAKNCSVAMDIKSP